MVCNGFDITSSVLIELGTASRLTTFLTISPSVTIPIGFSYFMMTTLPAFEAVIFSEICLTDSSGVAAMTGQFITSRTRTLVLTEVENLVGVYWSPCDQA